MTPRRLTASLLLVAALVPVARSADRRTQERKPRSAMPPGYTIPVVDLAGEAPFVVTTYGHWTPGEAPWIASVRFTLDELDQRAAKRQAE